MALQEKVFVAGYRGLLGNSVWTRFGKLGFRQIGVSSKELDLRNHKQTRSYLKLNKPDGIIFCAARVGGIDANKRYGITMLSDNARIQASLLVNAADLGIKKLIFISSAAIYPRKKSFLSEDDIWSGEPAPEHLHYAVGKLSAMRFVDEMNKQGFQWINLIPTNIYGPGDRWDLTRSHVIAGLIMRMSMAKVNREKEMIVWGSGDAEREFLYSDDAAEAICQSYRHLDGASFVDYNLTSAVSISIQRIAEIIADKVGYEGRLVYSLEGPTGPSARKLNPFRLSEFIPWRATTSIETGIENCVEAYRHSIGAIRP
jgi:GDP-L-fucose synthase